MEKHIARCHGQPKCSYRECPDGANCLMLVSFELESRFPHGQVRLGDVLHCIRQMKDLWEEEQEAKS